MSSRSKSAASLLAALGAFTAVQGAEPGDMDGDGRISIADVVHIIRGKPPAPGSWEPFEGYCHGDDPGFVVFLEALRRAVPGSYPHWEPVAPSWTQDRQQPPLEVLPEPPVSLWFEPVTAHGGDEDTFFLRMQLTVYEPVSAFSFILESDGDILQVPFAISQACFDEWDRKSWSDWEQLHCSNHFNGDLRLAVPISPALITGGRYVITRDQFGSSVWGSVDVVPPGDYVLVTEVRVPRGTPAGEYAVRLHPGSEVLVDGEPGLLTAPISEGEGKVIIERDVTAGFDGRVPDLQFDREAMQVSGKVEYRLVSPQGIPGSTQSPVAAGLPGQQITFRVQLRTEIPLNHLRYAVVWPSWRLECLDLAAKPLLTNPEDGRLYASYPLRPDFFALPACQEVGGLEQLILLAGARSHVHRPNWLRFPPEVNYFGRAFEYIKPLGEWTDVSEVTVRIPANAVGGTNVPLNFARYSRTNYEIGAEFTPYAVDWPCFPLPESLLWSYDLEYHNSFVRVLGENEPPPPPNLGIRLHLGDAAGNPGEQVEIPIFVASDEPLSRLRLVAAFDPRSLAVEGVVTHVRSGLDDEYRDVFESPGNLGTGLSECIDTDGDGETDKCFGGTPLVTILQDTQAGLVIDWVLPDMPADLEELSSLVLRINHAPAAPVLPITPTRETFVDHFAGGFEADGESGGSPLPWSSPIFSPAHEAVGGEVRVTGFVGATFRRGDANADGKVDLSDAVATLGYLFLGAEDPDCADAADADDDGAINISDAIVVLGALFLGERPIAPPFPGCGLDPAEDELGCGNPGCRA